MIIWENLKRAAAEYKLEVLEENDRAVLYSGPIEVTTIDSWRGHDYLYVLLPRWVTAKGYDRTQGHLDQLRDEQKIYEDRWPMLAAACPLTRHLAEGRPSGLESVLYMRYYRHGQLSELDESYDDLTEIEARLSAGETEKLWIERGPFGSVMHSALFGEIKYDSNRQLPAIESRNFEDLKEHLPEWYKRWHAGEPLTRSAFEEFFDGEFAHARAEYVAMYPALAREWNLELWNFGSGAPKFNVASYSFGRLEDAADTLRKWNNYYANLLCVV